MLIYEKFGLSAPPEVGERQFVDTLDGWGIQAFNENVQVWDLPTKEYAGFKVSIICHPYYWVERLWNRLVVNHSIPASVSSIQARYDSVGGFIEFYERIVESHGILENCLRQFEPDSCLRAEDFPWCLLGFLESLDYPTAGFLSSGRGIKPVVNKSIFFKEDQHFRELRSHIVKSESSFCERFEYY